MIQRTDRLLLQVRVSFEVTRFSQQHLIELFQLLVPTPQRTRPVANIARHIKE